MKRIIFILLILSLPAQAKHLHLERKYQAEWCGKYNGVMEYKLNDKTRVDCLTKNFAVEFDFAPKWAEAIGQSLYYGLMTNHKPAVVLIIEKPEDFKYYERIKTVADSLHFTLWYIKAPEYKE